MRIEAGGDFRLKKLVPPLEQAGAKAPVFAKVAEAAKAVVEGPEESAAEGLLELTSLVTAILYTQGETGIAGLMALPDSSIPAHWQPYVAVDDPDAIAAMWEVGIDISGQQTKKVDPFLRERVSYVVTLCDRDSERTCPIFPRAIWRFTWPIENPASARNRDEHRIMVRRARDEIRRRVADFVEANS